MPRRAPGIWINNKLITTSKQASNILFKGISKMRTQDLTGAKGEILVEAPPVSGISLAGGKRALSSVTLEDYIKGLKRLIDILNNKGGILNQIMVKAYGETVTRDLADRWNAAGGSQTRTSERRRKGLEGRGRPVGEFTERVKLIEQLLTNKKAIVVFGKGRVGIVSLTTLRSIAEITPTSSPFKSVFLMIELGTGRYAKPEVRPFASYGSTPYKVPPGFLNISPGDWFSRPYIAEKAKQFLSIIKSETKAYQQKSASGATIDDKGRIVPHWPLFAGVKPQRGGDPYTAEVFASKGRPGRHVLLNQRGVIRDFRAVLRAAQLYILELIDVEIRKVAGKGWPGIKATGLASAVIGRVGVGAK
jgi:hypothetical protein